jgi:hypothetical protein
MKAYGEWMYRSTEMQGMNLLKVGLLTFYILIGQSVQLLLAFASTVITGFSLLEILDQEFYSL